MSPQEMSNLATDMPALRRQDMVSTESDRGPSVPIILDIAGKNDDFDGSRIDAILIGS